MKSARLAVGYAKDDYWLASDLPATIYGQKFSSTRNHYHSENVILQLCLLSFTTLYYVMGTANNSVPQPLNILHNNILKIIIFSNYSCHVTPLYKNLNVLKLNDINPIELAKFMHKLHHGALHKIYDNFFQNVSNVNSYKTRFAKMQFVFFLGNVFSF